MDIEIDQSEFMLLFNHIYLHPFHLTEDVTELVDQVHNLFYNICFSGRRRFRQCRLSEPVGRRKPERRGVQPRPILLDSRKRRKKWRSAFFCFLELWRKISKLQIFSSSKVSSSVLFLSPKFIDRRWNDETSKRCSNFLTFIENIM